MNLLLFVILAPFASSSQDPEPLKKWEQQIGKDVQVTRDSGQWTSEWVTFELPAGLESFQIVATGSSGAILQITDLVDPKGEEYLTSGGDPNFHPYSQPVLSNAISANRSSGILEGTACLMVPNNPKLGFPKEGKWRIRTLHHQEPDEKKVNLYVVGKSKIPKAAKQYLPIRIWVAKESYWGKNQDFLRKMIGEAEKFFADIGIEWNVLSLSILEKEISQKLNVPQEVNLLAKEMNIRDAVNIYPLPSMLYQSKPVNGLACIGGPSKTEAQHSCFVSIYSAKNADVYSLRQHSQVLAHELAHYLGLFHTIDTGYTTLKIVHDPFSDTPKMESGKNFMDPGVHEGELTFSPQQIEMMLRSPALTAAPQ